MWGEFVDNKEKYIGGLLVDSGDHTDPVEMALCGEDDAVTKIIDITLEPNGKKSAAFMVVGEDFDCGFDVGCGSIGVDEDGHIEFHGYGGHTWQIFEPRLMKLDKCPKCGNDLDLIPCKKCNKCEECCDCEPDVMRGAPKTIYLQVTDEDFNECQDWDELVKSGGDNITWCVDPINDNDIEYVLKKAKKKKATCKICGTRLLENGLCLTSKSP